jgi:flavin-dependent dehydrogenase
MSSAWQVVVVGAGPAGAMAARECARGGARVLLVDRARLPRWKVCGACLGPGARHALARAGLEDLTERLGATPLAQLVLTSGGRSARIRLAGNVALSRLALDQALAGEAVEAGVTLRTGLRAELLPGTPAGAAAELRLRSGETGVEELVHADVVVDATGLAGGLGAESPDIHVGTRIGVGAVFHDTPVDVLPGDLHMAVGPAGYVGMVRDEEGHLNVAAAVDRSALAGGNVGRALAAIVGGEPGKVIADREPLHGWKGTPGLTRSRRRLAAPRLFRIGDAGGYVEPFTGEGIGWALDGGLEVAPHVLRACDGWRDEIGSRWHDEQSRRMRRAQRFCRLLAGGLRLSRLVDASVRVIDHYPALARPLVAAGSNPVRS